MRRPWRDNRGVDSHDVGALRSASLRTRLIRVTLVAVALVLLGAAASSARGLDTRERGLLPSRSTGVVVLDLSLSIADEDYAQVRHVLRRLIAADAPIGLVVFSDVPYELLPPGTPASELTPMLRVLVVRELGPPITPWVGTFRSGTRVSSALELARAMLERDDVENGSILLVSDLETAPDDVPLLVRTLSGIRRAEIPMRVYPLAPSSESRALFAGLLEKDAFAAPLVDADRNPVESEAASSDLPTTLLVLGGLLFAALALHERFGGRLSLPRLQRAR